MSLLSIQTDDPNVRHIGKYTFNNRFCLGEGSYGKVFLGSDTKSNTQVAIKLIDTKFIQQHDKYIKQQIMSEIEILKKFSHPNIVKFIDLIETQNHIYIITEYCRDGDLKETLGHKKLSEQEAFIALLHITEGFKELHKQGIIHRDLKPANILIDSGVFKIADFGFAKAVVKLGSTHMLKSLVGSPYYMAPQLLANQQYCYKCDIWSLAVIYFELVIGDLPWLASDPASLLKKILSTPISSKLKNCNRKITNFSTYFLERCLTIEETSRPSWDEVFQLVHQAPLYKQLQMNSSSPTIPIAIEEADSKINLESNFSSQTRSQVVVPAEELLQEISDYQMELLQVRQEFVFKHYITTELLVNRDELTNLTNDEYSLLKFIIVQTRLLTHHSILIISAIRERERKKPELFTSSKELNKLKSLMFLEHEYYCSFQRDVRDTVERNKYIDSFKTDPDLKPFLDLDQFSIKDVSLLISADNVLLKYGCSFLKGILTNFERISGQIHNNDLQTKSLMTLSEQVINYLKLLQHLHETVLVDYEDLFETHSRQKDMHLYISIIDTNLNALLLN